MYEQMEVPAELRPLFIPLSLARDVAISSVTWAERIAKLIHGLRIAPSIHYVSKAHAPKTYEDLSCMAARLKIETPLVFLTGKNNTVKTIQAVKLGGGYHGLLFNRAFIARRTANECRVIIAHELARIAQRHCDKKNLANKIWLGVIIGYLGLSLLKQGHSAYKKDKFKKFPHELYDFSKGHALAFLRDMLLVVGSKVVANFFGAYLSRRYQHEADLCAFNAFGDKPDEYLETLRTVEYDEALRRQRTQYQYKNHYSYVSDKIDALGDIVHPYIICFLKNELSSHQMKELERPAVLGKASLLNLESSLDDRIAYVHENISQRKKNLIKT